MTDTGTDEVRLVPQATRRPLELLAQVALVSTTDVGELAVLEEVPDALVQRVEIRCVARQVFQLQPPGSPVGEEVLDRLATMNGRAIPQDEQLAGDLRQ